MPCLWANIDDYLTTLIETAYTETVTIPPEEEGGEPTTEQVKTLTCVVAEQLDPDNHVLPVCLIRGYEAGMGDVEYPFGDGVYHIDGITYPYDLIVIDAADDYADIKDKMTEHAAKLRDIVRGAPALGGLTGASSLSGAHTEQVQRVDIGDTTLFIRGRAGQNQAGKYQGAAALQVAIVSQI